MHLCDEHPIRSFQLFDYFLIGLYLLTSQTFHLFLCDLIFNLSLDRVYFTSAFDLLNQDMVLLLKVAHLRVISLKDVLEL